MFTCIFQIWHLQPTRVLFAFIILANHPSSRLLKQRRTCPERKACPLGSTSTDWTYCDPGYYCPEGTPAADSYPCPSGYFTNRTDLASASECYPCPLGFYCGGGGSAEADGPCAAGYYCPLKTATATDNPCPAGTFSDSISLYLESQCEDCPPGYVFVFLWYGEVHPNTFAVCNVSSFRYTAR